MKNIIITALVADSVMLLIYFLSVLMYWLNGSRNLPRKFLFSFFVTIKRRLMLETEVLQLCLLLYLELGASRISESMSNIQHSQLEQPGIIKWSLIKTFPFHFMRTGMNGRRWKKGGNTGHCPKDIHAVRLKILSDTNCRSCMKEGEMKISRQFPLHCSTPLFHSPKWDSS